MPGNPVPVAELAAHGEALSDSDRENFRRTGLELGLASSTRGEYDTCNDVLVRYLVERQKKNKKLALTPQVFLEFCQAMLETKRCQPGRLLVYYSAYVKRREVERQPIPDDEQLEIRNILEGYEYEYQREKVVPRGALTADRLLQLVGFCQERSAAEYGAAFTVAYAAMLRAGDVPFLLVSSVRTIAGKKVLHFKRIDKRMREGNTRHVVDGNSSASMQWQTKPILGVDELLDLLVKDRPRPDERLFPNYTNDKARRLIKDASQHFKWDTDLKWDGPHTLRHGAAMDYAFASSEAVKHLMQLGGWSTSAMAKRYSRPRLGGSK